MSKQKSSLRARAEKIVAEKIANTSGNVHDLTNEEISRIIYELQVHQTELEMQNDELRMTQEKLQAEQKRYENLYDLAPVGYITLSQEGLILEGNLKVASLLGVTRNHLIGYPFAQFILKEDQDGYYLCHRKKHTPFEVRSCGLRMVRADGTIFWAQLVMTMQENNQYRSILYDVSEDKKLKEIIAIAQREWTDAFDGIEDAVMLHDKEYNLMRVNKAYKDLSGAEKFKDIIGKPYYRVFPKIDTPMHTCEESFRSGKAAEEEFVLEDGRIFKSRTYPVYDDVGAYSFSIHIFENITEQIKSKQVLRESEENFHSITRTAQDAILIMNDEGIITYWNEAAEKMFGYTKEEAIGKALHPLLAPERFHEAHHRGFSHFKKTGEGPAVGKTLELVALKKDATEFPIELSLSANMREGKWEAIGIIRDITERKKMEVSLQGEREFSDRLVNTAPVIIMVMNQNGQIVRFNHYMETLSGYSLNEVEGADWFSTFLPEPEREKMKALFLSAIDDIQTKGNVNTIITKDGQERLIEWYDKTLKSNDGHTIGLLSIGADVTDRYIAQEGLKLFRTLLDHSSDAIEVLDPLTLQYIDVNETACHTLGYTYDELLSMTVRDIDLSISEYQLKMLTEVLTNEGSTVFESIHRRKNGTVFPVEISISLVVHADKEYRVAVVRDITERKRTDALIRRSNRALKTLSAGNMALVQAQNEGELLKSVVDIIVKEGGYSLAVVDYAQDNLEKSITPMSWSGLEEEHYWAKEFSWNETAANQMPVSKVIRTATKKITRNIAEETEYKLWRDAALAYGYTASIAFPLIDGDKVFGALNIYASEANAFTEEEVEVEVEVEEVRLLEELANDLAYGIITLRTRVSHEQQEMILRESLEQSIQTIAATVEARDPYTAGHQNRVSVLATAIARKMNLSEIQVQGIHFASIIHDLGKIHVPAEILSKPGKLTPIEFMLIQSHPQEGYEILKDVKFPWPIADIILQHHEKIDGSGYPQGLKGDQILLEAKIICVADIVEAMSSHRPYRASLGIEAALDEIKQGRGTLYDAAAVDACVLLFEKNQFSF